MAYNKHIMPNRNIITRLVPTWTLDAYKEFMAGGSRIYTNEEKTRVFGIREIVKSELSEHPYCRIAPHERYYTSLQELIKDYPDIRTTIYDYDNKLQPWQE